VIDPTYPLLSDWNGEATHGLGIAHEYRGLKDVSRRSAWLVDADGVIRGAWTYGSTEIPDLDELLAAANALEAAGTSEAGRA
jgi:peroxiredoxin